VTTNGVETRSAVGVPVIAPVLVLKLNPAGRLELIAKLAAFVLVAVTLETAVPLVKVNGEPE
jgi:hypothetical protein